MHDKVFSFDISLRIIPITRFNRQNILKQLQQLHINPFSCRMSWASGINRLPDGTTVSIDEANHLMSVLLGEQSLSPTFSREVAMGVWNMWRIGIEEGWNENQMRERINEKRNALTESLSTVFKSRLADLRKHFSSIRYADPTVIDSEWVVSREKESGSSGVSGRNGAVSCEFTLKSIAAGEFDTKELKLNMNKMELQDLYWTLKQAQNVMYNIAKS